MAGQLEAILVELGGFDAYRFAHPGSALRDTGWWHPIGFNVGFLALASRQDLLGRISAALWAMQQSGELQVLAAAAGLQCAAPEPPDIAPRLTPARLLGE